jgi:hypothetical protein
MAVLGTQSDKTLEAMTTMLQLLRKMPLAEARFVGAQQALDEEYRSSRVDPRQAPILVLAWDDLGEPSDPRPRDWKVLRSIEPAALAAFAARVSSGATLISVMGDTERFDRKALAAVGAIEAVPLARLFGY